MRLTWDSTEDPDDILDLVVKAQNFYRVHRIPTAVKACAVFNGNEALKLAGVDAFTLTSDILQELHDSEAEDLPVSLFDQAELPIDSEKLSFIDDEMQFRKAVMADG